ncbi:hypothetical protein [Saprospira grandis]|uniref:hypothetical protein n=1 Tax=Saprospira grandis TaxID=1008 RepID=UPI0022DE258F|nr:hypothetical protein [Saprospira grandis]WBM75181.1 hypothetical protein OP864_02840 [Saprospira grandis]
MFKLSFLGPAAFGGRALLGLAVLLGPSLFRFAQKLGLAFGHPYRPLGRSALRLSYKPLCGFKLRRLAPSAPGRRWAAATFFFALF